MISYAVVSYIVSFVRYGHNDYCFKRPYRVFFCCYHFRRCWMTNLTLLKSFGTSMYLSISLQNCKVVGCGLYARIVCLLMALCIIFCMPVTFCIIFCLPVTFCIIFCLPVTFCIIFCLQVMLCSIFCLPVILCIISISVLNEVSQVVNSIIHNDRVSHCKRLNLTN